MKGLAYLNKYFARYKWRILAGMFFVVCANFLNVLNPFIVREAINLVSNNLKSSKNSADVVSSLQDSMGMEIFLFFLKFLGIALLAGGFTFLQRQFIIVVSRLIEYDMKSDIYDHYQRLDLAFYRRNNTGDLMSRITEDVSRVRMYVGPAIMYAVNLFFTIVFAIVSMLIVSPKLTMWVLIPLPVLSVLIYYVNELVEKASTSIQAKLSDLTTNAQETYSGIRVVQAYTRESEMLNFFTNEAEVYKQKQLGLAKVDSIYFPAMTFLVGCSIIMVVYFGGMQVGMQELDPGALAQFIMLTTMLMWPVSSLGWTASMIQRAIASQRRINEFLQQQPGVKDTEGVERVIEGDIAFNHVSFTYPDTGIKALKDVTFHIKPGERIAIIGRTGSGKSTIADLLMRMYDVSTGDIRIDGVNVKEYKLGALRRQIGFVPQDVFLFSETITGNIGFGLEEITPETATRYAHYASIGSEIESFPEGFNTMVGERGVTLSGGQKQRISIARALVKQPNVLVLDDSLSAVDTATEKEIQQNLDEILSGKTAIIITHRIFSLIHFDNILVLDDGQIAEQGTHKQLLSKNGIYAEIYRKQQHEARVKAEENGHAT